MQDQRTSSKRIKPARDLCSDLDAMLAYETQYGEDLERNADDGDESPIWEDDALSALAAGEIAQALGFLDEAKGTAPCRRKHWQYREQQILLVAAALSTGATADDDLTGPVMEWFTAWLLPYTGMEAPTVKPYDIREAQQYESYLPAGVALSEAEPWMVKAAIAEGSAAEAGSE